MNYYNDYPTRCKSCNEPIASKKYEFEQLVYSGVSPEDALNQIGIFNDCSRIAMLNPVKIYFNEEHKQVVEGFVSVNQAKPENANMTNKSKPIYRACLVNNKFEINKAENKNTFVIPKERNMTNETLNKNIFLQGSKEFLDDFNNEIELNPLIISKTESMKKKEKPK